MMGLSVLKNFNDMLSRFDTTPDRDRQTNRQTWCDIIGRAMLSVAR